MIFAPFNASNSAGARPSPELASLKS